MRSPIEMRHSDSATCCSGKPPIRPAGPGCKGREGAGDNLQMSAIRDLADIGFVNF